ncbi:MAG: hypothetical protein JWN25_1278 [Verrucomicrobiales bacterium]|nr:hypothetical protein [Verrucomicrobiales bacterium]
MNLSMENVGLILAITTSVTGLIGAWAVIPHRVREIEQRLDLELKQIRLDHDLLIEIRTHQQNNNEAINGLRSAIDKLRGQIHMAGIRGAE